MATNRHEIAASLHERFGIAAKIACVNGPLDYTHEISATTSLTRLQYSNKPQLMLSVILPNLSVMNHNKKYVCNIEPHCRILLSCLVTTEAKSFAAYANTPIYLVVYRFRLARRKTSKDKEIYSNYH